MVEVGMEVEFKSKKSGKQLSGKIIKVLDDDESVKIKTPKGNIHVVKLDAVTILEKDDDDDGDDGDDGDEKSSKKDKKEDDNDDDSDDDEVVVEVGMKIEFESKSGKSLKGKVIKILEDEESVKVKTPKGNIHTVKLDDMTLPEKAEDDDGDDGDDDDDDGRPVKTKAKTKAKAKVKKRRK